MPQSTSEEQAVQPDWLLLSNSRMPDWGPTYTETPLDSLALDSAFIAEPWNTITATFFIWLALAWLWRLRGRYRDYPFVSCCLPILLAGGIGGVLFHGTRASKIFFLLDVVPISLLGLLGSLFMAIRFWGPRRGWYFLPAVAFFYYAVNRVFFKVVSPVSVQWQVNLSYASLAIVILTPIALVLWKTKFRHAGWIAAGIISFAFAWFFRLVDFEAAEYISMGSHWLWHTFGAISTAMIIQFFYKVEGDRPMSVTLAPDSEQRHGESL